MLRYGVYLRCFTRTCDTLPVLRVAYLPTTKYCTEYIQMHLVPTYLFGIGSIPRKGSSDTEAEPIAWDSSAVVLGTATSGASLHVVLDLRIMPIMRTF